MWWSVQLKDFSNYTIVFDVLLLEQEGSAVSTIIVRGSTDNIMDDTERALDDGINTFRTMAKVVCLSVCPSVCLSGVYYITPTHKYRQT